jgi:HEAT repeats
MTTRTLGIMIGALLWGAWPVSARQPRVVNGQVTPHPVSGALDVAFGSLTGRLVEPAWVGYAVPVMDGEHHMCCWSGDAGDCCGGCRLEPGSAGGVFLDRAPAAPVRLEPSDAFFVLYRVERGQVERIRMFSEECPLDAGGRTIHWLTGVRATDSVALLGRYVADDTARRLADSALSAIAMHADASALDRLIANARGGSTPRLRGQALFWLAQRAGDAAVGAIREAVDRDPDTDVKKRAVFALSQLPKDEGVPRLIEIARSHSNMAVRRQAFFWLGQSKDPRALAFFAEVLQK